MGNQKLRFNIKNKVNALEHVSWQQARVLELQKEYSEAFDTSAGTYEDLRANYRKERAQWNSGGPEMADTKEVSVQVGDFSVPVRVLYPKKAEEATPVIFFIHGGGMVVGDNDTHGLVQRKLAAYSGCIVAGIEYTLSPEGLYPRPIDETVGVINYFQENAEEYKIDPNAIGFAGDSGGANISMGSIVKLRDDGFDMNKIKAAILYYGSYGIGTSISRALHGGAWDGMSEEDSLYYRTLYIGDQDPLACPYYSIYTNDLSFGIPPCFIVAAELDPLKDDSLLLHTILQNHGIKSEYVEYKGALHAFIHYSKVMDDAEDGLRRGAHFFAHECGLDPRN